MTDLKRHSEGIWRSIYIFEELENQGKIIKTMQKQLKFLGVEYSYCHYGEVVSADKRMNEAPHVTFRVNFEDARMYVKFLDFLKKQKWKWEDHNYDEPLWVKKAYVIGTMLANEIREAIGYPDIPFDGNFLQLLFHGCFNDLHFGKHREIELYYALFSDMISRVYHVNSAKSGYSKRIK